MQSKDAPLPHDVWLARNDWHSLHRGVVSSTDHGEHVPPGEHVMRYSGMASALAASWFSKKSTSNEYSEIRYTRRKLLELLSAAACVSGVDDFDVSML
jgi:hypothetical protein